jgi:hypothetical protein
MHTPDFYCQRCFAIFKTRQHETHHLSNVPCLLTPGAKLDGIDRQQSQQLTRKFRGSDEEKWYAVWDILFPGTPHPASIYQNPIQLEILNRAQEYSLEQGLEVFHSTLQSFGHVLRSDISDDQTREFYRQGMNAMWNSLRLQPPWNVAASPPSSESRSSLGGSGSAASNLSAQRSTFLGPDSGVGVASQASPSESCTGLMLASSTSGGEGDDPLAPPTAQAEESFLGHDLDLPTLDDMLGRPSDEVSAEGLTLGQQWADINFSWESMVAHETPNDGLGRYNISDTFPTSCNGNPKGAQP